MVTHMEGVMNMRRFRRRCSRRAVDVFKCCPRCESPNILNVDEDVFCTFCDWSSVTIDASTENGDFSAPVYAEREPANARSLASAVDRILEENPFLTGDPVFA